MTSKKQKFIVSEDVRQLVHAFLRALDGEESHRWGALIDGLIAAGKARDVMSELTALSAVCVSAYATVRKESLDATMDLLASFVLLPGEDEDDPESSE